VVFASSSLLGRARQCDAGEIQNRRVF
jgi:hypothetical protein